ncbi:MAG: hypothetical protein KVP17_001678 [Porospora cf. gigantea B]|uniref:uncharacterized protein n=1 Tax=Porospora cf. gigantea B TaxID=2853592 RepID=UPI0035717A54|nr:MAG: hypothetical protein KVP17_001678 [Porospora cf. gigantea B]
MEPKTVVWPEDVSEAIEQCRQSPTTPSDKEPTCRESDRSEGSVLGTLSLWVSRKVKRFMEPQLMKTAATFGDNQDRQEAVLGVFVESLDVRTKKKAKQT